MNAQLRQGFEAWVRRERQSWSVEINDANGIIGYADTRTFGAWIVWQAALAAPKAVVWVNPDDLANPQFVGINAAKAGHEQLGKHYTMPLYAAPQADQQGVDQDA